jgi:hypothetical protein
MPASGTFTVKVDPTQGDPTTIGAMQVNDGRGSWTGRSHVPLRAGSRIALVDASGAEVCHGTV